MDGWTCLVGLDFQPLACFQMRQSFHDGLRDREPDRGIVEWKGKKDRETEEEEEEGGRCVGGGGRVGKTGKSATRCNMQRSRDRQPAIQEARR